MKQVLSPDKRFHFLLLILAGAVSTLAFQPFNIVPILFVSFAMLLYSWAHSTAKQALFNGWFFSMGLQCAGVSWIYFSLHYHGSAPPLLAALIILLLAAYLSLYPAILAYLIRRYCSHVSMRWQLVLLLPLAWGVAEWLQGIVMTGFAWMQPGYALIDTPWAGFAPLLGNHAVGVFMLMSVGALLAIILNKLSRGAMLVLLLLLVGSGWILKQIEWTERLDQPVKVSLVQGNVPQHLKWKRSMKHTTLQRYHELSVAQQDADLIIWPETAVPGYRHLLPDYLDRVKQDMKQQGSDLLLGIFVKRPDRPGYYNSLVNMDGAAYRKRHLVPLGEYIPLRSLIGFFNQWIKIPMSDIQHGEEQQALLRAAGQPLGVSICFEDAFARDVIRDLPEATLLVNVSNDAWFDGSHEPMQHHAIARMRALEAGRTMLRVTNTGVTSVIDADGSVVASLPQFETGVLNQTVYPSTGATPYVIWGDYLFLIFALVSICFAIIHGRRFFVERGSE